jgi:hypothetical protein
MAPTIHLGSIPFHTYFIFDTTVIYEFIIYHPNA